MILTLWQKISNVFLDFIFPKNRSVLLLESLPLDKMMALPEADEHSISWCHSLFSYKNKTVRELIWQLKYKGNTIIARKLAGALWENILAEISELKTFKNWRVPLLIPIPLSRKRLSERGFNQCELLTKYISEIAHNEMEIGKYILIKKIHTNAQTKSHNRKERLENLKDCFKVRNPRDVAGRNIILIDDVMTTGATLSEARRALRAAGARDVIAFTIAH